MTRHSSRITNLGPIEMQINNILSMHSVHILDGQFSKGLCKIANGSKTIGFETVVHFFFLNTKRNRKLDFNLMLTLHASFYLCKPPFTRVLYSPHIFYKFISQRHSCFTSRNVNFRRKLSFKCIYKYVNNYSYCIHLTAPQLALMCTVLIFPFKYHCMASSNYKILFKM